MKDITEILADLLKKDAGEPLLTPNMSELQKQLAEFETIRNEESRLARRNEFLSLYSSLMSRAENQEKQLLKEMKDLYKAYKQAVSKLKVLQAANAYAKSTGNIFPLLRVSGSYSLEEQIRRILGLDGRLDPSIYQIPEKNVEEQKVSD